MRILLDTNVPIAAFISRGACNDLLEHCVRHHTLLSPDFLLDEHEEKLTGKLGFSNHDAREVPGLLRGRVELVNPKRLAKPVCRDPDDDHVPAAAHAGKCDCIVTGDQDLLVLRRFRDIPILTPGEFWRAEKA